MKRLVTSAIGVPIALAALFLLPPVAFFAATAVVMAAAALELVAIARAWAPQAPLGAMPLLAVAAAVPLSLPDPPLYGATAAALALGVGMGCVMLLGRTPVRESLPALGALAFGIPYFALPIASLSQLQRLDPWLVFLLVAVVWLGDTAAYYVGTAFGKHRMAPVVSPKKSWEGALASLLTALAATAVWSWARLGAVEPAVLGLGLVTAVAAQLGDLVESALKRGAGVKDSGRLLPGHGGFLDRADALLFAAPVLWAGVLVLGSEAVLPS